MVFRNQIKYPVHGDVQRRERFNCGPDIPSYCLRIRALDAIFRKLIQRSFQYPDFALKGNGIRQHNVLSLNLLPIRCFRFSNAKILRRLRIQAQTAGCFRHLTSNTKLCTVYCVTSERRKYDPNILPVV
jgi:hypothetical protein